MELIYAELSSPGPVREFNEDCVGFWQPQSSEEKRSLGAVAALADGAGGPNRGERASRLAVETALATFSRVQESRGTLQQILIEMFNAANRAVYDKAMAANSEGGMSSTLCLVVLSNDRIAVGNVGGSRIYLLRAGEIKQLSTDHTYVGMQQKFGLIDEQAAKNSKHRSLLTGSLGLAPTVRVDAEQIAALKGDRVVLCSDGLYGQVADSEIAELVSRLSPAQACRQLVSLAESRAADDNISIQIIHINALDEASNGDGDGAGKAQEEPPRSSGYELQPGQTLDERFLLTEIVSRSGMATIFKATDLLTRQEVAVKVPFLQFECDPGFYSRFVREGEIVGKLDHPYILKFIPVENRSRPYLVTEYLRGHTLSHLLKSVRCMPEADALRVASLICEALNYLHGHGVIHRDLKPQNVMICFDGSIRIMDFGIAKSTGRRFTFSGFTPAMGTPEYMAPEQVKGRRGDERTDIYSLGVMLYQMVVGEIPFAEDNEDVFVAMNARVTGDPIAPRKRNRELSEQTEEIILHAMERDPKNRYPSSLAMKEELDHPEAVPLTGRCHRLLRPAPWKRHLKNALWIGLLLTAIIGGLVQLILFIMRRGP
jgi:serine/threonine protein phosphatase PrpC